MTSAPIYVAAAGVISPIGSGLDATERALRANKTAISPLSLFSLRQSSPLPVGQVMDCPQSAQLPRTHLLARAAAAMAMHNQQENLDGVIIGCTTGGILTTEQLLRENCTQQKQYRYHGLASVAEDIATRYGCTGPALVASTACSSSAVAIGLALRLLRAGKMQTILAGGVDSLSRLTYFGFNSLQLVDNDTCKPMDSDRHGIAVAEGAAMLLLTTVRPPSPLATLLGAGLSCDAHHAAAPHPEGNGALQSMQNALQDAGLQPTDIDYINLHGTGTPDNDLAEAKAIRRLFSKPPPLSSIKGMTGHSLAAAGALEAVVACLAIQKNLIPGNCGCREPDPTLHLIPQAEPLTCRVDTVLSNSFGFGGNNGSLVFGRIDHTPAATRHFANTPLAVHGFACITGAGASDDTLQQLMDGKTVAGRCDAGALCTDFPPRVVRRIKRLARLALTLTSLVRKEAHDQSPPASVFLGTGWGAMSETYDFLSQLNNSEEKFVSPTDFIGSVHNSPASQIAIQYQATGANVTVSGGDYSFEQALLAADNFLDSHENAVLIGVDEGHDKLSPLLDASIAPGAELADGGGALLVNRDPQGAICTIEPQYYQANNGDTLSASFFRRLGDAEQLQRDYAAVFIGIADGMAASGARQLADFQQQTAAALPIWHYRRFTGEFASASAVASALAAAFQKKKTIPGRLFGGSDIALAGGKKILVLNLGRYVTATAISPI